MVQPIGIGPHAALRHIEVYTGAYLLQLLASLGLCAQQCAGEPCHRI